MMAISNNNTRSNVTMPKEIYNKLAKIAKYEGRSVSNLILMIIKKYLRENQSFTKEDYED